MRHFATIPLLAASAVLAVSTPVAAQETEDPYVWLEEVEGERALAWAIEQSEATLAELKAHPAFDSIFEEALEILNSDDRLALPEIVGDGLYNFWQDAEHERGIWRRTAWESYLSEDPEWETVLDIDALAEAEGVPWSFDSAVCLAPEDRLCMVSLSRGGADATEIREFDLETKSFVEGGFFLPEAKTAVAWRGPDALLVATDFGEGSLTTSGYPRIAKLWKRGTPLESATTLFEGATDDVGVFVGSFETSERSFESIVHWPSFFKSTTYILQEDELLALELPADAQPNIFGEQLVVYLRSPWEIGGRTYSEGSVIAIGYESFLEGRRDFDVVVEPGPRSTVEGAVPTKDYLLVTVLENVRGQLWRYHRREDGWVSQRVEAPDFGTIEVEATDPNTNRFFFTYSTYTRPSTLFMAGDDGRVSQVQQMANMFDAEGLTVGQHEATSPDGTRVPYFLVKREGIELDGQNPTLLYGYGGFQISMTPRYSGLVGKAWLARGGTYAVANIRGGGEFGPSWWRAAMRENRQRAYDDFLAVAEDLVERGITSPDHLGIQGGSNGGLLVGVALTQRPDLFDAVVVQVPLLDMRRYNKLLAGASWMEEYGDPDVEEDWAYISKYSPYQNVDPDAHYPRALFYTTTRDDRVHPGHARKMAAKMSDMGHPIYYFENTEGGHGSGVTPEQRARMYAITYTYLLQQLADRERETTF